MASTRGRQVVLPLTNKSGGSVAAGDVVVVDTANDTAFTTTTTGRAEVSLGVAQETIANNATGRVLVAGHAALVNVPASVTRGHYIETHTVAKQATGNSTRRSGSFGQFLTGGTSPTAWLWGQTDPAGSGGASVSTIEEELGANVTIVNASQDYDGPSASFAAGTWLVIAQMLVDVIVATSQSYGWLMKLWDGSTVYGQGYAALPTAGNYNAWAVPIQTVPAIITLGGTTTLKISARCTRGSSASRIIRDDPTFTPGTNLATRLVGYKVS